MQLTPQQKSFFDTFGFLVFKGAMAGDIGWIVDEFESVLSRREIRHDSGSGRVVVPFIDQSERLCTLLEHPVINGILTGVLGEDFNYLAGDGRYYSGDTGWHPDGDWTHNRFVKLAFYLDPLTRDTGALRVIPGSHVLTSDGTRFAGDALRSQEAWGIPGHDVPALALESNPGDVVVFHHNTLHASFGGKVGRRMFTLNCGQHAQTPEELEVLRQYIGIHLSSWSPTTHGELMVKTASPGRMRHLRQVLENQSHLPALYAKKTQKKSA